MPLSNLVIPTLTFLNQDYSIDTEANLSYIKMLNSSSVERIILLGTTSEGVLLGYEDKCKLIGLYAKYCKKRILLAPSTWSVSDFKHLSRISPAIVDSLFLPNAYFNKTEGDLIAYMHKIYTDSMLGIYLYNLPKNTRCPFEPETVRRMRDSGLPIKGIKLSHSSVDKIRDFKKIDDFEVFYGSDKNINEALRMGANAVVCQNLSPSIDILNNENYQTVANQNRLLVSTSENKIRSLKQIISSRHKYFNEWVI